MVICLLFLLAVPSFGDEPEVAEPNPFTLPDGYGPIDWPNFDIPVFVLAISGFWIEHGKWPKTIDEVNEGFRLWAKSLDETKTEIPEGLEKLRVPDAFKILKVRPMWHGVAYKLIYTKKGISVKGLIVLDEADSVDEIMKSARYSRELGGIVYAVPF